MSLPFLDGKKMSAVISAKQSDSGEIDRDESPDDMQMIAEDIISAVHSKDAGALASAIRAAFDVMEMQPHDEVEHEE